MQRECGRANDPAKSAALRSLRNERGSEIVQLVLALPILIGILWSAFEIRQIVTLRMRVRDTASQAARYMSGFAAQPNPYQYPDALQAEDIFNNLNALVSNALSGRYGTVEGHDLTWSITWYRINDPFDADWEGNHTAIDGDAAAVLAFIASLRCDRIPSAPDNNAQFGLELRVSVPWSTVLFGLGQSSTRTFTLALREFAMGAVPCQPYLILNVLADAPQPAPGGCDVVVHWAYEASYTIDLIEIVTPDQPPVRIFAPLNRGQHGVFVPAGTGALIVRAVSGDHIIERELLIDCPAIEE